VVERSPILTYAMLAVRVEWTMEREKADGDFEIV